MNATSPLLPKSPKMTMALQSYSMIILLLLVVFGVDSAALFSSSSKDTRHNRNDHHHYSNDKIDIVTSPPPLKGENSQMHSNVAFTDVPDSETVKELLFQTSSDPNHGGTITPFRSGRNRSYAGFLQHESFQQTKDSRRMSVDSCPDPQWNQVGPAIPGLDQEDQAGYSLALSADGNMLIIGAPFDDNNGYATGMVRVFERNFTASLNWTLVAHLEGRASNSGAGFSVAISANGDIVAFGSPWNNAGKGYVRVLERSPAPSGGYVQIGGDIEGIHVGTTGDRFGGSIDLSSDGTILAVGGHYHNSFRGYVKVYERDPGKTLGWSQIGNALTGDAHGQAGVSVSLSKDGNILAYSGHMNRGYVKVYQRSSTAAGWTQLGNTLSGSRDIETFGISVSIARNCAPTNCVLAVGAALSYANGKGRVRVFDLVSTSWNQIGGDFTGQAANDGLGRSVALSDDGNILAIGTDGHDNDIDDDIGNVQVYQRNSTLPFGWSLIGDVIEGENAGDKSGRSVALSANGSILAIGSPSNADNGDKSGHVRIFNTKCTNTEAPTSNPSSEPSVSPSLEPSNLPSVKPSAAPSLDPFSWDIALHTPGYLKDPPIAAGVQQFITKYEISDRSSDIQVFKNDCITPSNGLPLLDTIDNKTNGDNLLAAVFMYNQSIIQESNLWTANSTGGDADFCVKLSLYTGSSDPILFNFIETVYSIQVDLTAGFSTAIDIVRTAAGDGGKDTIDADENITVYQCDDSYNQISNVLTQGESLQICVETEDDSPFEVSEIKDVKVSQNGTKNFDYVSSFVDSYWAKSSCQAVNTVASVCKVKMQLLGDYFADANPVDLTVEGVVKMDYLGRRRRDLLGDEEGEGHRGMAGSSAKFGIVGSDKMPISRDLEDVGAFTLDVSLSPVSSSSKLVEEESVKVIGEGFSAKEVSLDTDDSSAFEVMYGISTTLVLIATVTGMIMVVGNRYK